MLSEPVNLAQYRQAKVQAQRVQAILDDLVREDKAISKAVAEFAFSAYLNDAPDHGQGQF